MAKVAEITNILGKLPECREPLTPKEYRIIKHCGMPLEPSIYSGVPATSVCVAFHRWTLIKAAKAVFNLRINPALQPTPNAPLTSQPWPSDMKKTTEEDITNVLSNKTTNSDWTKAFSLISPVDPEHAEVYCYLSDFNFNPGKLEEDIFLAKQGTKGISLVCAFFGINSKGDPSPQRMAEREKQRGRLRQLAEQAEQKEKEKEEKKSKKSKKNKKT
jgi:hypothetical protein